MPPGQDSLVIIVDYKTTTLRTNPSISVASKVECSVQVSVFGVTLCMTGAYDPSTPLRRNTRTRYRHESSASSELFLQGDRPFS